MPVNLAILAKVKVTLHQKINKKHAIVINKNIQYDVKYNTIKVKVADAIRESVPV